MSQEPSLRKLLAPMTDRQVDLEDTSFRVDRARVLARMAKAGERDRPDAPGPASHDSPRLTARWRRSGWMALSAAVACAVVLVFGARLWQRDARSRSSVEVVVSAGSATQFRSGAQTPVLSKLSTRIAAVGDLETAADSNARVTTGDGKEIELRSQTRVSLGELQASKGQLKLLGGSIRCRIPHRPANQPFQVVTADVTVVDLGTVFTVTFEGPSRTTVITVEEGEVLVRHAGGETRLQAPSTWSSVTPPAAPATSANLAEPEPAPSARTKEERPATRAPSGRAAPAATLAIESRLLREGLAAERQGRSADAISALSQLITEYPHSPLAPDARAALARVEASVR